MITIPLLSEAYSDARLNLDSLDRDIKQALAKVRKAAAQMQSELRLDLTLNTTDAERKLNQFAANAARVKAAVEADTVDLRVDIDLDVERAATIGREARQAVDAGFGDRPLDLNVDLDFEAATFYGRVARLSVEEGFGSDPIVADVTADFDAALFAGRVARDSLEAGVGPTPVQVEVDVDLGSLVTAKGEIEAFTRFDNDVKLYLETSRFDAAYAKVVAKLEALTKKQWTVDLDTNAEAVIDLIEEVIAAAVEADRLKVGVTFDTDSAEAARQAADQAREQFEAERPVIRPDIDVPDPEEFFDTDPIAPDLDTSRWDRTLADLKAGLDSFRRDAANLTFDPVSGDDAVADAARLRERITRLLDGIGRVAFQAQDDEQVLAVLQRLEAQARQLDAVTARIGVEVRGDETATGKLIALGGVVDGIDDDILIRVGVAGLADDAVRRTATRAAEVAADVEARAIDVGVRERAVAARRAAREAADESYREALKVERKLSAEVLKLRRLARRAGVDLEVRDRLKESRAALAAAQERTRAARREAQEQLRVFNDADRQLAAARRQLRIGERVESILVRTRGIGQAIADLGLVRAAREAAEGDVDINVDVDGGFDMLAVTERVRERTTELFRGIQSQAADTARSVREAFRDRDFEFSGAGFRRELDSIAATASGVARRVRDAFSGDGLSISGIGRSFRRLWADVQGDASRVFSTIRAQVAKVADAARGDLTIRARVRGVAGVLADLAKITAAKVVAGRDISIGVNVRGGITRTLGRLLPIFTQLGAAAAQVGGTIVQSLGQAAGQAANLVGQGLSRVSDAFQKVADRAGEFVSQLGGQLSQLSTKFAAVGPIISSVAKGLSSAALPAVIVAAITALAGPVITAIGGLIGGAVAFLSSSLIAGVAAGGLPIAAILFDEDAKDRLLDLVKPLKDELVSAFAPVTDLIVDQIAPAFVGLAREAIRLGATISDAFILPISTSLANLFDALLPSIQEVAGAAAIGISSFIDVLSRFAPLFSQITLAIGPGLTNGINAILEVSLRIASIFADDIGAGFQGVADLLLRIEPALVAAGESVLPILQFVGQLIELFVNAGAQFEGAYRPIGESFADLGAQLPELEPLIAGIAVAVVSIIDTITRMIPFIAALGRVGLAFTGVAQIVIGGLLTIVGTFAKLLGEAIDLAISGIAGLFRVVAAGLDLMPGIAAGTGDALRGIADKAQGVADGLGDATRNAQNWGQSAIDAGGASLELAFGLDGVSSTTDAAASRIAELNGQLRTGKITLGEYADQVGITLPAGVRALSDSVASLTKRIREGEFALASFIEGVAVELPTAADFLDDVEIKPPELQMREDRDQRRQIEDLNRRAQRDAEDIRRAAEDYERAIQDAAELRNEAPERYEWGADNFNAVLFADSVKRQEEYDRQVADAQRNIEDRARALEDARRSAEDSRIAAEDAAYDAAFGTPEAITVQVIDIRKALAEGGQQIADEAQKALTLIEIRSKGYEYDPFADFLEALDPEQFRSAIEQLGGVGSAEFEALAAEWAATVAKGDTTLAQAFEAKRSLIEEESLRLDRLLRLRELGLDPLLAELAKIEDAETFNAQFDALLAQGGEQALKLANDNVVALEAEGERLAARANAVGVSLADETLKGINDGLERGVIGDETSRKIAERFRMGPSFGTGEGEGGDDPIGQARQAGEDTANAFADGFDTAWADDQVQSLSTLVDDLFGTANYEAFAVAGQDSAEKFYDGAKGAFENDVNRQFVYAALRGFLLGVTLQQGSFNETGDALGGAVIAGVLTGIETDWVSVTTALDLYADSIARGTQPWLDAGEAVGGALAQGIAVGLLASTLVVTLAVGAVLTSPSLAVVAGDRGRAIGEALTQGIQEGLLVGLPVLLATATIVANAVGTAMRAALDINSPSRVTETIGGQIVDGLVAGIEGGRQQAVGAAERLAGGVAAALAERAVPTGTPVGMIGAGAYGATLTPAVNAAAERALYDRNVNTSNVQESTVIEETTINVYGVQDGPEAAREIARRKRDEKFLRRRQ